MNKIIITAALTGSSVTREMNPNVPIDPDEIVQSAIECWNAGASIAHIHVRDPDTSLGTLNYDLFKEVVEKVRDQSDLIICLTTSSMPGVKTSTSKRLLTLRLQPELIELPMGSINLAGKIFQNSPTFVEAALIKIKEKKVKPELAVLDMGMIVSALRFFNEGLIEKPLHFQILLGTPWGAPASIKSLLYLRESIPSTATWSLAVRGEKSFEIHVAAITIGGHIRVGMEDYYYYKRDVLAQSNTQLIERIVRIAKELGREPATPSETRNILKLF